MEYHIPGYNYCGPGTKLEERMARGDKAINELDACCQIHDLAYANSDDAEVRVRADQKLGRCAKDIAIRATAANEKKLAADAATVMVAMATEPGRWV